MIPDWNCGTQAASLLGFKVNCHRQMITNFAKDRVLQFITTNSLKNLLKIVHKLLTVHKVSRTSQIQLEHFN